MKIKLTYILILTLFFFLNGFAFKNPQHISFKENKGQVSDQFYKSRTDVLFSGNDGQLVYHLKNNGISYQLSKVDSWKEADTLQMPMRARKTKGDKVPNQVTVYRLDVNWLNANTHSIIKKGEALEGYDNYYLEACPQGALNVKSYKDITYQNLYNGIDLKWYEKNGNLKYDYLVSAGADYKQIQLQINGALKISINKTGELIIKTPLGELTEAVPYVTQNGKQLAAKWIIKNNMVSFDIKNIDPTLPFVIDPLIRVWGTYYGGNMEDTSCNPATDVYGNVYLCGQTKSGNFSSIATTGAYQTIYGGGNNWGDAFLVKFNALGARQWGTYYGGAQNDFVNCISTDTNGDIYMTGGTSTTNSAVIATPGSHQPVSGGGAPTSGIGTDDAFLVKFDPNGIRIWGTFYGGNGYEWGYGCSTDALNNVYITGLTSTANGNAIASPGCQQPVNGGGIGDGFVAKFNSGGVRQWGTFFGGIGREDPGVCDIDAAGNVFVPGQTSSPTTPNISTTGCHQLNYGGGTLDGLLIKYDAFGIRQWGTYYGGNGTDATWIAKIFNNAVFVSGSTTSAMGSVIATAGAHQAVLGGGQDAFITKFDLSGVRQWGTYYGGAGADDGSLDLDAVGNIYLFGSTSSPSGTAIATPCTYQETFGGNFDVFIAKFNNAGVRQWGTFYGGSFDDNWGWGCIDRSTAGIYLSGYSSIATSTIIADPSSYQPLYGGGVHDAFLVKFNPCVPVLPPNMTPPALMTICNGNSTVLSSSLTCGLNWYSDSIAGTLLGSGPTYSTPSLSTTTNFYIEDPSCGVSGPRTPVQVTVVPFPVISITTNDPLICIGQSSTLTASGATTYTWAPAISLSSTIDFSVVATPVVNTIYTVTGSNGNCSGTNSIPIQLVPQPTPVITAVDNKVCNGSTLTLNAFGAQTYSWFPPNLVSNPNGSVVVASPVTATNFTLVGVNTIGMISCVEKTTYSVTILQYTQPSVSGNITICQGDIASLSASGGNTFSWLPAGGVSNELSVSPPSTTVYSVTVSNNGYCGTTATVLVNVNPKPVVFAGRDTVFNLKEPMFITATGDGILKWIVGDDISCPDCPSTQIFPVRNSCYVVQAVNGFGCKATDDVCIDVSHENVLYIPNTFTPNGDGLNDVFYVYGFGFSDVTIDIFDRWGQTLFSTTDASQGWNGKYKGQDCKEDVYVYKLSYKTVGGKVTVKTGNVNLVR